MEAFAPSFRLHRLVWRYPNTFLLPLCICSEKLLAFLATWRFNSGFSSLGVITIHRDSAVQIALVFACHLQLETDNYFAATTAAAYPNCTAADCSRNSAASVSFQRRSPSLPPP